MNLVKQSKKTPHERYSFGWKLSETSRIKFGKIEQKELKKDLDELRNTVYSDKGIYIDLSNTQRLSEDSAKWVLFIADDVAKNNVIGLDVYVSVKQSIEVKAVIDRIKQIIASKTSSAIRIKKCKNDEAIKLWQLLFIGLGTICVVGGHFLGIQPNKFKDFEIASNVTQILGFVYVALGVMPVLLKYKNKVLGRGDEAKEE
jgi:hypothetical protein